MPELLRTDSTHGDFIELVQALDAELAIIDGDDHAFYSQFNKVDALRYVVLAYESERPVGCGAIREYAPGTMEVKRMYVLPAGRNKGVATQVLLELERWARELGATKCILETGKRQPDAIALYQKNGYTPIANFGQYIMVGNSVCFAKELD
jgi:putative acetyltransferase